MEIYPEILLPRSQYKCIDCELSSFYLIRNVKIQVGGPNFLNELNEIDVEYICSPKANIRDLSTSLLSHFLTDHTKINLTAKGRADFSIECEPSFEGLSPLFPDDFTIDDKTKYWVILVSDIAGKEVLFDFDEKSYVAISYFKHTPMKWNFWHYSVRWTVNGTDLDMHNFNLNQLNSIYKRIGAKARSLIAQSAISDIQTHPKLNDSCFMNNA